MVKKSLLMSIIIVSLMFSSSIWAKTKACLVKPAYDIIISKETVQVVSQDNDLIIKPSGLITLNGSTLNTKPIIQKEAKQFQAYLRQQLPDFESKAYLQLNDVRDAFAKAIREKLGNKSELLKHLNNLHSQLVDLLHQSIVTQDGVTYFYYQPFNNIKKEGEKIGEKVFYSILGDSFKHLNLFKNYSAIKKIAKQEWKQQKVILKSFDDNICQLITNIDNQYNHLMLGIR